MIQGDRAIQGACDTGWIQDLINFFFNILTWNELESGLRRPGTPLALLRLGKVFEGGGGGGVFGGGGGVFGGVFGSGGAEGFS